MKIQRDDDSTFFEFSGREKTKKLNFKPPSIFEFGGVQIFYARHLRAAHNFQGSKGRISSFGPYFHLEDHPIQ